MADRSQLSARFLEFARSCQPTSPLYSHLSSRISSDPELLGLAARAPALQPVPNLFLASVHHCLKEIEKDPLRLYYPNLERDTLPLETSFEPFKVFCLRYADRLIASLENRTVQTNEVRRCCILYPIFSYIQNIAGDRDLALLEIGASAGLNLCLEQYAYDIDGSGSFGRAESSVVIRSRFKGFQESDLPQDPLRIGRRIGLDLKPVDVASDSDVEWLDSLVWPEDSERRRNTHAAIEIARRQNLDLRAGDAVEALPAIVNEVPDDLVLVVFHTHVANQMSDSGKEKLLAAVNAIAPRREVFHFYNRIKPDMRLDYFVNGRWRHEVVGTADMHARQVEWNWERRADR